MRFLSPAYRLFYSVGLLSAAILAFQIVLMQILSYMQWHHFAYMVISIAMLGFGAAGTLLAIFRKKAMAQVEILVPMLMIASGLTVALVTDISQLPFIRFDSYLLFAEYSQIGNLLLTYMLFFIPFFLSALALGLIFIQYIDSIGKIYFANMVGSGAGGLLGLALVLIFSTEELPPLIAILPVLSGLLILPQKKKVILSVFAIAALLVAVLKIARPGELKLSQFKDLSKTLMLPEASVYLEKNSPYGLIHAVTSPVLRYAPGLSLTARQTADVRLAIFINGDWFGAIAAGSDPDTTMILNYTTSALPYRMAKRNKVLVMKAGTGTDIVHALSQGSEKVVGVEPNSVMVDALKNEMALLHDSLFYNPRVTMLTMEPRTFLFLDTSRYDLIVLPVIGSFGGVTGLYALHEQFILTKEAFHNMWTRLNDKGVISITTWLDYPVRNPLRILATMAEVMDELGLNARNHIVAIRSWGTVTFVLSKPPLTKRAIQNVRSFSEEMLFDPALMPGLKPEDRSRYNQLQDDRFFSGMDQLLSSKRNVMYTTYDFNLRPATDDKPYFSQFIRWKSLPRLAEFFGNRSLPFFETGYVLVIVTLLQIVIVSFLLILLPLFWLGWKGKNSYTIILYFGGIGLGYMFLEMVFIQRIILYLGNPVYAASTVITTLLIFSGLGSYASSSFRVIRQNVALVILAIVFILLCYSFVLTGVLQQTIHLAMQYKLLFIFLSIAPLAFLLGVPFPTGLSHISKTSPQEIPWAWGINGCISVVSTAFATVVAVEMGFHWVMMVAALAYSLALVVQVIWGREV